MHRTADAPHLEMDPETGVVTLVDPSKEGEDGEFTRLGTPDRARRRCPPGLSRELKRLEAAWVAELATSGGGRRELRRLYREGSIR